MRKNIAGIIDPTKSLRSLERFTGISPILPSQNIIHAFRSVQSKYKTSRIVSKPNSYYQKDLEKIDKSQIDKTTLQEMVSERLWQGRSSKDSKIPKIANLESESKIQEFFETQFKEEESKLLFFINKLTVFKKMKDLLVMNFRISKSEAMVPGCSVDGILIELKENFEKLDNELKINEEELLSHFISLNTFVREIIRILKVKLEHRAAEGLEIIWRFVVKILDSAVYTHFFLIGQFSEMLQKQNSDRLTQKKQEIYELKAQHFAEKQAFEAEAEKLKEKLEKQTHELAKANSELLQKNQKINNLTSFENREEDLNKLKKILSGFDALIEDSEKEKVKQMIVLNSFASLISSAEDTKKEKQVIEISAQTEPISLTSINTYEEFALTFGSIFGDVDSADSLNNFFCLFKRIEPKETKRLTIKKKVRNK